VTANFFELAEVIGSHGFPLMLPGLVEVGHLVNVGILKAHCNLELLLICLYGGANSCPIQATK